MNQLIKTIVQLTQFVSNFAVENIAASKPSYMNASPHNHNGILYDAHYANDGLGAGKLILLQEKNYLAVSPKLIAKMNQLFYGKTVFDTAN